MKYVRGLDGLRAVAVIAVVLFHARTPFFDGGFLGVSLFFTLSGFLITTLLLAEHADTQTISLRRFYSRRARRLLPAAYTCLLLVAAWSVWWSAAQERALRGDLVAAVTNVANWRFAFASTTYQDLFVSTPSPLAHFWSLAIEEQIYLILPVVVLVSLRRGRTVLAVTTAALLAASFTSTVLTSDRDLAYNGTHTRAAELLVGAALAQLVHRRRTAERSARRGDWAPGALALGAFAALVVLAALDQAWVYRGGLLGVAVVSAILIDAVAAGRFPSKLLESRPLVAIGALSYGIYLFHWPLFLLIDESRTGLNGIWLLALRLAATAVLAICSYRVVEQPIRRGNVGSRNVVLVPVFGGVAAMIVVAALLVTGPALTPTQQLLAIGEQSAVQFVSPVPVGMTVSDTGGTPPMTHPSRHPKVLVVGSDSSVVDVLSASGFDVIDRTGPTCPVDSADERCGVVASWRSAPAGRTDVDTVVVSMGSRDEVDSSLPLEIVGAWWKAVEEDLLEVADGASSRGQAVVIYSSAPSPAPLDPHLARITLMRPWLGDVVRSDEALVAAVSATLAPEEVPKVAASSDEPPPMNVILIGDSTSIYLAKALSDGGDGRLAVMWAGANGCPLAPIVGLRASADSAWSDRNCGSYATTLPPLMARFVPDVVLLVVGPTELAEHRYAGDSRGHIAGDPVFTAARDAAMTELLGVLDPSVSLLVADCPGIRSGAYASTEMTDASRLDRVNEQVHAWDARWEQVEVFDYRSVVESAELARGSIRADGVHPDAATMEELARTTFVDRLIGQVRARSLSPAG